MPIKNVGGVEMYYEISGSARRTRSWVTTRWIDCTESRPRRTLW